MEETSTTTTATSVVTLETLGPINSEESSGERWVLNKNSFLKMIKTN